MAEAVKDPTSWTSIGNCVHQVVTEIVTSSPFPTDPTTCELLAIQKVLLDLARGRLKMRGQSIVGPFNGTPPPGWAWILSCWIGVANNTVHNGCGWVLYNVEVMRAEAQTGTQAPAPAPPPTPAPTPTQTPAEESSNANGPQSEMQPPERPASPPAPVAGIDATAEGPAPEAIDDQAQQPKVLTSEAEAHGKVQQPPDASTTVEPTVEVLLQKIPWPDLNLTGTTKPKAYAVLRKNFKLSELLPLDMRGLKPGAIEDQLHRLREKARAEQRDALDFNIGASTLKRIRAALGARVTADHPEIADRIRSAGPKLLTGLVQQNRNR